MAEEQSTAHLLWAYRRRSRALTRPAYWLCLMLQRWVSSFLSHSSASLTSTGADCIDFDFRGKTSLTFSEIRVWTTEGDLVYTLSGHTSFVYSLTILPNGDIASSGEDRTIRIWRGKIFGALIYVWVANRFTYRGRVFADTRSSCDLGVGCFFYAKRRHCQWQQRWRCSYLQQCRRALGIVRGSEAIRRRCSKSSSSCVS